MILHVKLFYYSIRLFRILAAKKLFNQRMITTGYHSTSVLNSPFRMCNERDTIRVIHLNA